MSARIRMEMAHSERQQNSGQVQGKRNVECGSITIWDNNKLVYRGEDGKFRSCSAHF